MGSVPLLGSMGSIPLLGRVAGDRRPHRRHS